MPIERFIWTTHAERMRRRRLPNRLELEREIKRGHPDRRANHGEAEWLVSGLLIDGRYFVAVYDHPHGSDHAAVRIVSV
ncbi:MAG TPA: hypothetical protein VNY31_02135 [Solirubrobacteraceae bacterium]|nr:hypothetical protein [Solirubrobacteraceae bacterium]